MSKLSVLFVAASLTVALIGCGSSSDSGGGGAAGSCTISSGTGCIEWSAAYSGTIQTACSQAGGTYSSGACSSANRVGRCTVNYAGTYSTTTSYYSGTATSLQQACNAISGSGQGVTATWTAG